MEPTVRRFSIWALVACLGCAAIGTSTFLPWLALGERQREDLGVSEGDLRALEEAAAGAGAEATEAVALLQRLRRGAAATGREWLSLIRWSLAHAEARQTLEPREQRVFNVSAWALGVLPFLGGGLALALLLDRWRSLTSWALGLLLVQGLLLGGLAGLVWLGASVHARERGAQNAGHVEIGLHLLALGGGACLLAALFGVTRRTWWRGWGLGLLLGAVVSFGVTAYVRG